MHDGVGTISGGYRDELIQNVKQFCGWDMEITLRSDKAVGFQALPMRWVVEKSFSWLENFRRLATDYEYNPRISEAMIYLAFTAIMINRIKNLNSFLAIVLIAFVWTYKVGRYLHLSVKGWIQLNIYTIASKSIPFFKFNTPLPQAQTTLNLVDGITSVGSFGEVIVSSRAEGATTEYIKREVVQNNVEVISQIRKGEKKGKRNVIIIGVIVFVLIIGVIIFPIFMQDSDRYLEREGQLFYGEKLMEGVNPKSVKDVGYATIKDLSNVYYQGEILLVG